MQSAVRDSRQGSPPAVVAAVREEIAQAWEKATEDSNWTEVFEKLVAVFDPDPEPAKASKAKKEVKMEQTPRRSQRGAVFLLVNKAMTSYITL